MPWPERCTAGQQHVSERASEIQHVLELKLHAMPVKRFMMYVDSLPQGCFQGEIPAEMVRRPSFSHAMCGC